MSLLSRKTLSGVPPWRCRGVAAPFPSRKPPWRRRQGFLTLNTATNTVPVRLK